MTLSGKAGLLIPHGKANKLLALDVLQREDTSAKPACESWFANPSWKSRSNKLLALGVPQSKDTRR